MRKRFVPEAFNLFKEGYGFRRLGTDAMAGLIVGIVALPLAIAFAIASGVKPEQGIVTAVVAGFMISVFSGSRVQIGGPTGAFVVIVLGIVNQYGYAGLAAATIMAGVLLICMGMARLGAVIKFIPYPMTVGFTAGIALVIAASQCRELLGLPPAASGGFVKTLCLCVRDIAAINPWAVAASGVSLGVILAWQRYNKKIPGSIIAILACTAAVHLFDLPVATIGSRFGHMPTGIPLPRFPDIRWDMLPALVSPAITIAVLGAIESLLSAVVADGMTGRQHHSNTELVAQGMANIVTPLFGGIPATGAIARTATNIKNGGSTPVSGVVHSLTLLVLMLFFGRWAVLIPLPTLGAVLLMVAYHMSEWRHVVGLLRSRQGPDMLVMATTFGLTVFVDLTVAIEAGVVLAALLFMHRMADVTEIRHLNRELCDDNVRKDLVALPPEDIPDGVEVFEIQGPFFFGAANKFKDTLRIVKKTPRVLVIRMRLILSIDATAMQAFGEMLEKAMREGTRVILSGVRPELRMLLEKAGVVDKVGADYVLPVIDQALDCARQYLARRSER